jgi:hypothetical protein
MSQWKASFVLISKGAVDRVAPTETGKAHKDEEGAET